VLLRATALLICASPSVTVSTRYPSETVSVWRIRQRISPFAEQRSGCWGTEKADRCHVQRVASVRVNGDMPSLRGSVRYLRVESSLSFAGCFNNHEMKSCAGDQVADADLKLRVGLHREMFLKGWHVVLKGLNQAHHFSPHQSVAMRTA
jgi:hypothetical protein